MSLFCVGEYLMRRVVVSVNQEGRSFVESDEQIPSAGVLWCTDGDALRTLAEGINPELILQTAQPPPGGFSWALSDFPGGSNMTPKIDPPPGMDEDGFHITNTVNLVYLLSGTMLMDLDEGRVELHGGDAVVLQAGRHAWRNPMSDPVRVLNVSVSCEPL